MDKKKYGPVGVILFFIILFAMSFGMYKNELKNREKRLKYDLEYQSNLQFSFESKIKSMMIYARKESIVKSVKCFDSKTSPIDMDTDGIEYYFTLNDDRKVTNLVAKNDKFQLVILKNTIVNTEDIGRANSSKKYKIRLLDENLEVPVCNN